MSPSRSKRSNIILSVWTGGCRRGLKDTGDGNQFIYTVKRGDTLWDIGRHYGVSVTTIDELERHFTAQNPAPGTKTEPVVSG